MAGVSFRELIEYTDWQRTAWHGWFRSEGDAALKVSLGGNGDGRLETIGDAIRHVFTAEKRYVERIGGKELTDQKAVGSDRIEPLFLFGGKAREDLKEMIAAIPEAHWDELREFQIMNFRVIASPRKIVTQTLIHEIRHWAQIATILRLDGRRVGFHDFLRSPVMGGSFSAV